MKRNGVVTAGLIGLALMDVVGCGPAYLGPPPSMNPPPARLTPLPQQQAPLMLPPSGSSSLQQVPNMPAQQLFLPPKANTTARYHSVRAGETLSAIAQQYGVTVQQLMKSNAWDRDPQLQPGDMILIP